MRIKYTAAQKIAQFFGLGFLGGGVFGGVCLFKGDEKTYKHICSALHCFGREGAQKSVIWALNHGLYFKVKKQERTALKVSLFGLEFENPIGIAAGFDRNGEAVVGLTDIGFGFVEVGNVTPLPHTGDDHCNDGHNVVKGRLQLLRKSGFTGIIGVSLGVNNVSLSHLEDYVTGVQAFGNVADYLVIDLSNLNTGLRSIESKRDFTELLIKVLEARKDFEKSPPILLKITPNLCLEDKVNLSEVVTSSRTRIDGLIISNASTSECMNSSVCNESEKPLTNSTSFIGEMFELTSGKIPIIGVGEITSGQEAWNKIIAGSSLVQLQNALVFEGPPVVLKVRQELLDILEKSNYKSFNEAIGAKYRS